MMKRREYNIAITINAQAVRKVLVDPHYEEKHSASIDDQIILKLVEQLDGQFFEPEALGFPYTYFVTDDMVLNGKRYKMIWLLEDKKLGMGLMCGQSEGPAAI